MEKALVASPLTTPWILATCAWHSVVVLQAVSRVSAALAWPMAKMAAITGAMRKRDGREVISPKLGRCNDGMGFVS
ncbi:hypothetical protein D3C71_2126750 [compost metagenome]